MGDKRIQMKSQASGPDFNAKPKQILLVGWDVTAERAKALVDGGYAVELVDIAKPDTPPVVEEQAVETATTPPTETAESPAGKKGRHK